MAKRARMSVMLVPSYSSSISPEYGQRPRRESLRNPSVRTIRVEEEFVPFVPRVAQFTVGDTVYEHGCEVFGKFDDGRSIRWYAGTITGVHRERFCVEWCEGRDVNYLCPEDIVLAKDVLKPGIRVSVPDLEHEGFCKELTLRHFQENGQHLASGKKGAVVIAPFRDLLMELNDVTLVLRQQQDRQRQDEWSVRVRQPESRRVILGGHKFIFTESPNSSMYPSREKIIAMVLDLGGSVANTFDELVQNCRDKRWCFLVSSDACTTEKFLICLAANIACVGPEWITEMNRLNFHVEFEAFRLPAGNSILSNYTKMIPWQPRRTLLDNLRVGLYGNEAFCEPLKRIITAGKGDPSEIDKENVPNLDMENFDVVIVEQPPPTWLLAACEEDFIPVVYRSWLVETLIRGKKQSFESTQWHIRSN